MKKNTNWYKLAFNIFLPLFIVGFFTFIGYICGNELGGWSSGFATGATIMFFYYVVASMIWLKEKSQEKEKLEKESIIDKYEMLHVEYLKKIDKLEAQLRLSGKVDLVQVAWVDEFLGKSLVNSIHNMELHRKQINNLAQDLLGRLVKEGYIEKVTEQASGTMPQRYILRIKAIKSGK